MGFMKHILAALGTFAVLSLGVGVLMILQTRTGSYSSRFPSEVPILGSLPLYIGFIGAGLLLIGIMVYIMTKSDSPKGTQSLMRLQPGSLQAGFDPNLMGLIRHYHPSHGMFGAWLKRAHGEQRVKLLKVLNEEEMLLIQRAAMLEEAVMKRQKSEVEFERFVVENAAQLFQLRANEELIRQALNEGLTLHGSQTLRVEGRLSDLRLNEEKAKAQLRLDEEQLRSSIKLQEQQRLTEIELWGRRELANLEREAAENKAALAKEMARAKMMPELLQLEELHSRLSETFKAIAKTQKQRNGFLKTSELERLQAKAEYFKQQIQTLSDRTPKQKEPFRFDDDEDV